MAGRVAEARAILARLLAVADERGESISYALHRLHLCELALRTGAWEEAARLLDEWERDGELLVWPCYDRCRALVAAGRGLPEETRRWAVEAIARAQRTGLHWDVLEASKGARHRRPARAQPDAPRRRISRSVWEHLERDGVEEPGVFPVAPDLVEALVDLGKLDEAQLVTDRVRQRAEQLDHPWGLTTARRCAALVRLASPGEDEQAAADLTEAAAAYGALGLRFDRARTLLSLGRAQRRLRKWARGAGERCRRRQPHSTSWARPAGRSRPARSRSASVAGARRPPAG